MISPPPSNPTPLLLVAEKVEMQFQPALDAYIAGDQGNGGAAMDSADTELEKATQWKERCAFPFENFLPVFHLARSRGLPMVAMGVDRYHGGGWGQSGRNFRWGVGGG